MSTGTSASDVGTLSGGQRMETFSYDDAIVRKFMVVTLVWGLVAFLVGLIVAAQLAMPGIAADYPVLKPFTFLWETSFLNFGRLRPLHTNAAIFAFAGNAIFACIYYALQRLCKARMWSDTLSKLHFWGWQAIIVAAAVTLPLGYTQGKEYAELEWPIDLAIAVVWLGFFGTNFFMTILNRRERHLYVAIWFWIATIVTVTLLHVFNSLAIPAGALKSYSVYAGVQDAMIQWWYGHNAVAFFLTTPFLGLMYYFMPKAAERPVFSYRLSIIHFWSLVFIYIWAGPHHLHYTALPQWASTLGMLFSVMLWMPSWGGMINGLMTLRGAWHKVSTDPILKFFVVGVTFYGMSTFEGPMLSIKSVNALSHYTDWTIAHVHAGALGWNGFLTFGMIYWLMPRLFQTPLWSKKLSSAHFWIATIGILLYIIPIYTAGITQGLMWRAFDEVGNLKYPDFVETVAALIPFYWVRLIGGTLYFAGAILCGVNMFMTWRARPAVYEVPVHMAPALRAVVEHPERAPEPLVTNTIELGKKLDVWTTAWWHRVWERKPVVFTFWTIVAVLVASVFSNVPMFLVRSNVPTIASVKPYTPLELYGRDVYLAEGCYNCHSQMIRPLYGDVKRYGEYSKAGEFVYDHPFQWGSRRLGPDLAREGGQRSDQWHYLHFMDPRELNARSLMPSYAHLASERIDYDALQRRVRAMAMIGVPYAAMAKDGASISSAKEQAAGVVANLKAQGVAEAEAADLNDTAMVAMIAYLQRLGTDIVKPAETPSEAPAPGSALMPLPSEPKPVKEALR